MSHEPPAELRTIEWLPPWEPTDAELGAELRREVGPGHPLFEHAAIAVGRRVDCDDVLFWLPSGPGVLAVVHLTWTGKRERSPQWPSTQLFSSVADWVEHGMRVDYHQYSR